jgi:hypothetical protein
MNQEHSKEDHYREAAQLLNAAERVGRDTGESVNETLAFLTRGPPPRSRSIISLIFYRHSTIGHTVYGRCFAVI